MTEQTNQLAAFNSDALKERVSQHIQGSFGALIPPEVFAAMTDKAVKEYFEDRKRVTVSKRQRRTGDHWNASYEDYFELDATATMFECLVFDMVHEMMKVMLKQYLDEHKELIQKELANMIRSEPKIEGSIQEQLRATMLQAGNDQLAVLLMNAQTRAHDNLIQAFRNTGAHQIANELMARGPSI